MKLDLMKRSLLVSTALGLLVFTTSPAAAAQTAMTTGTTALPTLSSGSFGPGVTNLQQQLRTLGYFAYPSNTGYYGTITAQALRDFQSAFGYKVTGVADSIMQRAVDRAVTVRQLAAKTVQFTGIPYRWGGTTTVGFDCSGFVWYMYKTQGLALHRLTAQMYFTMGTPVERKNLQPGDLLFFNIGGTASHVGIYLGQNKWISATSSKGIWTYTLDNTYWGPRYDGARRI